jgi:hypothetical protein
MACTRSMASLVCLTALLTGVFGQSDAHTARRGWTYPPACCKGTAAGGDCQAIPHSAVKKGSRGYTVFLHPGDHRLITRQHLFFIPYGNTIPSGDENYHICLHPTEDNVNCFFAPPENA